MMGEGGYFTNHCMSYCFIFFCLLGVFSPEYFFPTVALFLFLTAGAGTDCFFYKAYL
jgi:hypothetical protein